MIPPLITSADKLRAFQTLKIKGCFTLRMLFRSGGVVEKQFDNWESMWCYMRRFDSLAIRQADII